MKKPDFNQESYDYKDLNEMDEGGYGDNSSYDNSSSNQPQNDIYQDPKALKKQQKREAEENKKRMKEAKRQEQKQAKQDKPSKGSKTSSSLPLGERIVDKFKSKTFLGILILIVCALVVLVVSPLINGLVAKRENVVKIAQYVPKGNIITADDLEIGTVAQIDKPQNVATSKDQVIGTYAKGDLFVGDLLTSDKLTQSRPLENPYLYDLPEGKIAISISVSGFAEGLSGKLKAGDIVSLFSVVNQDVSNQEETEVIISQSYPELKYVKVLAVTNASVKDIDVDDTTPVEAEKEVIPATITLEVVPYQAQILAGLNKNATIHVGLVARADNEEVVNAYLKAEEDYITAVLQLMAEKEAEENANNPFADENIPVLLDPYGTPIVVSDVTISDTTSETSSQSSENAEGTPDIEESTSSTPETTSSSTTTPETASSTDVA